MARADHDDEEEDDLPSDWLSILLEHYENDEAAEWLSSPHEALDGKVPLNLVREGRQDEVAAIVEALDAGACY